MSNRFVCQSPIVLTTILALTVPVATGGPARSEERASASAAADQGQKKRKEYTWYDERNRLLEIASAILSPAGGEGSVVTGPPGAPAEYDPENGIVPTITLTYEPSSGSSGWTRKFWARDADGKKWKVKYVSDELYTEVAATRVMWRLGYAADHVYPATELVCIGCKDGDPWKSMDKSSDPPVTGRRVVFRTVSIERSVQKFTPKGKKIEFFDGQGVNLTELDELIDRLWASEPERAAELDSLKVLAFMLQNSDTKPDNQRLVAMKWPSADEEPEEFNRALVVMQDVGATFGRGKEAVSKIVSSLNYDGWAARMAEPWASGRGYTLKLQRGLHAEGGWKNPEVSAAGLRFFLERSTLLTHQDLVDIFELARFPQGSGVSAEQWAETWELGLRNLNKRLQGSGTR